MALLHMECLPHLHVEESERLRRLDAPNNPADQLESSCGSEQQRSRTHLGAIEVAPFIHSALSGTELVHAVPPHMSEIRRKERQPASTN